MWASILGLFTGGTSIAGSLLAKIGVGALILAIGVFIGYRFTSNYYKAAAAKTEAKYAAELKANAERQNTAENQAMEQLNDLNHRLLVAREAAARHHASGACLDDGSVRVINGAIGGAPTTR